MTSLFDTLPLYTASFWVALSILSTLWGARLFHHMPTAVECFPKSQTPWMMVGYGHTLYGLCSLMWLFRPTDLATTLWIPLSVVSALLFTAGYMWLIERVMIRYISAYRDRPSTRSTR